MASSVTGCALRVTDGNIRNSHIPITHVKELFPSDSFGGSNAASKGRDLEIILDGVGTFASDIDQGKNILRIRSNNSVGLFYSKNDVRNGTRLFIEKVSVRTFRVSAIG